MFIQLKNKNSILLLLFLVFPFFIVPLFSNQGYDIVVDARGSGHFRTVQHAIDSVRAFNPAGKMIVYIKKGVYKEKLLIQSHTCQVHFIGEDRDSTILSFDDGAKTNNMGTFRTYSFKICGNDITLENLTVENAASALLGQAVALHIEGDRAVFVNCCFLGNQDTVYTGKQNSRHLFVRCYIEGTTDFIFGPSTVWFEECTIRCKANSYITAASTPEQVKYGYVFNRCKVLLNEGVDRLYLGRPWRPYAMTLFMQCDFPKGICPEGWHNWGKTENESTARYMEYCNTGEGADVSKRVGWGRQLSEKEANEYTPAIVLKGYDNWTPIF